MAHEQNDLPENSHSFSDFILSVSQEGCGFNDGFNGALEINSLPRYPMLSPEIAQTVNIAEVKEENSTNVLANQNRAYCSAQPPSYYLQPGHQEISHLNQPFVSYPNNQHENPPQYRTSCQINQQNYDGYIHTSSPNGGDRASISNSPYTPTVRQDYPITPPGNVTQQPKAGAIPSMSDYPGEHNFEIYFGAHTESAVKSAQFTHSTILDKLFVKMNALCPIQFRCSTPPPEGCVIRAIPIYTRPEHITEIVSRCPNHQLQDSGADQLGRHLIRAEQPGSDSVQYGPSADGRYSVTVAYTNPAIGSDYITVFYKYMCLSSCVGGINRRPIMTLFTLETPSGVVIGRRCVEVRICSCPGRDRSQEERRKRKAPPGYIYLPKKKKSAAMPSTSTAKTSSCEGTHPDEFFLRVKGKEKYEILKKIKEALDLKELISPQQEDQYRQREASEETVAMREALKNYFKTQPCNKNSDEDGNPFPR